MPRPNPYTKEMDDFIRDNIKDKGGEWVIKGLKERFGFEPKYHSLFSHCQRHGIECSYRGSITEQTVQRMYELQDSCATMKELYNKLELKVSYISFMRFIRSHDIQLTCNAFMEWQDEWNEWLVENLEQYKTYQNLSDAMCKEFGEQFTMDRVKLQAHKLGLKKQNQGGYKKGNIPWHILPIGTERNHGDRIVVKIAHPNKWQIKQNYVWEQLHDDIVQDDEVVIFLDRDRTNFSPDNLRKIKRNVALNLGKSHLMDSNPVITETAVMMWELHDKVKEARRE